MFGEEINILPDCKIFILQNIKCMEHNFFPTYPIFYVWWKLFFWITFGSFAPNKGPHTYLLKLYSNIHSKFEKKKSYLQRLTLTFIKLYLMLSTVT